MLTLSRFCGTIKAAWLSVPRYAKIAICASWLVAAAMTALGLWYLGSLHARREAEPRSVGAGVATASAKGTVPVSMAAVESTADDSASAQKAAPAVHENSKKEKAAAENPEATELARNADRPVAAPRGKDEDEAPATEQRTGQDRIESTGAKAVLQSNADKTAKADKDSAAAEAANPAQTTIDRAVAALLKAMKDQENPMGYVFPPISQRKIDHYKEVPHHYSRQMVEEPVYKYDTAMVTRPVMDGTRVMMRAMPQTRVVGQIGTRQVERLVYDPNGPIVQMVKEPVWTTGGPDFEREGWLGDNAMALLALLRNGVTPQEEPIVDKLVERLASHISAFGTPDSTWDLAWAMMAFVEYPGARFESQVERLYGRLLSGQINQGPGKGMWGPVSVSPALLRRVVEELYANQTPALPAGNVPMAPRLPMPNMAGQRWPGAAMGLNPELRAQIEAAQERLFITFNAVSVHAPRFADATKYGVLKDVHNTYGNDVAQPGWPVNLYREATADLESTALAVYAMRVIAARHKLPASVDFPQNLKLATRFSTREALVSALLAISQAQHEDGSWDEMVRWQAVDEFRNGAEGQFGPVIEPPDKVPSQVPPIATAEACDAIEDILYGLARIGPPIKDRSKPHGPKAAKPAKPAKAAKPVRPPKPVKLAEPAEYREQIAKGRRRLLEMIANASKDQFKGLVPKANQDDEEAQVVGRRRFDHRRGSAIEPRWGGLLEPYAMVCQFRLDDKAETGADSADQGRLAALTFLASQVALQQPSGLWPLWQYALHWTPSSREREIFLATHPAAEPAENTPPAAKKAGQSGRKPRAKNPRAAKNEAVPADDEGTETMINSYIYGARMQFGSSDTARLATAHMLHYLSGAMTGVAAEETPAAPRKSPAGAAPAGGDSKSKASGDESKDEDDAAESEKP